MGIRVADLTELGYGGVVTALAKWDKSRAEKTTTGKLDLLKKASFWGYTVVGLAGLVGTIIRKPRGWEPYTERIAHGFIYDFPRVMVDEVVPKLTGKNPGGSSSSKLLTGGTPVGSMAAGSRARASLEF